MGAPSARAFSLAYLLTAGAAIGCIIAIIVIVDQQFWTFIYGYYPVQYGYNYVYTNTCYLGTYNSSTNLCYLNWALAAIAGFFLLVAFFLAICRARSGRPLTFVALYFVADALLLSLAIVDTIDLKNANNQAVPSHSLVGWRNSIIGLSWAAFSTSFLGTLAAGADAFVSKGRPQQFMYDGGVPPIHNGYAGPPPTTVYPPSQGAYGTSYYPGTYSTYPPQAGAPQYPPGAVYPPAASPPPAGR